MEIPELVSYQYPQVKFVTLQELLANNTRSLIRDLKKCVNTHERSKTSVKFALSCTIAIAIQGL